jgi:ribosomal protein S18 acetylase RimI-like enzyme
MKCKLTDTQGLSKHYGYFDGDEEIARCSVREKSRGESKGTFSLEGVFIDESYRGRGLCTKFLTCVLAKYSGKTIFLNVLMSNEPAIKCYKHLGFKVIDEGKSTVYMRKN